MFIKTIIVEDLFGRKIEIPKERWKHACIHHPEIEPFIELVKETIESPDFIKMSSSDKSVRMYYKYFSNVFDGKYILVVIKTNKRNFLLTTYITDYIKAGEELWKNKN
ncbi:MAG: hypothetical protein KGZ58_03255 [Ignavibacteriales bacterium]|nr:hypothetical protein [Ignavibacteriales bacterium]